MTIEVDILTLGILVAIIILTAFLLPMIWQVKRTAQEADEFLHELRRGLLPVLSDLREITDRINRSSENIEKGTVNAKNLVETMEDIATSIRHISSFAESAGYVMLGVKTASKVFLQGLKDKETNS